MKLDEARYTSSDIVMVTGLSHANIQTWANRGILKPTGSANPGSGSRRLYSACDIIRLAIIDYLSNSAGFTVGIAAAMCARMVGLNGDHFVRLVAIGTGSSLASSVTTWLIFRKGPGDGEFTVETQYVDYDLEGHGIERILPLLRPEGQYVMDAGPLVRKVVSGLSKLAAAEEAVEKALVTA